MELEQHADRPELTVEIGGQSYDFGEILIDQRADLEAWIRKNVPHPLDALKGRLEGLPVDVAAKVAENARQEAKNWPPRIGTAEGTVALLSKEDGQTLALYVGLQKFHSGTTREQSDHLYRLLGIEMRKERKRRGDEEFEGIVKRIFSVMFGQGDPELDEAPKAETSHGATNGYRGTPSTVGAKSSLA